MRHLIIALLVCSTAAEARFGKANSSGGSTHRAVPASSRSSSSSSGSSNSSGSSGSSSNSNAGFFATRPSRGYLWNHPVRTPWWTGAPAATVPVVVSEEPTEPTRVTVNADFMAIVVAPELGFTYGLNAGLEGEYFGFTFSAQQINVKALDSSGGMDQLQQFNGRVTYAFLSSELGRVRAELGADLIFAADMIFFGGTLGFSGVINIAGPFAFEASLGATVFPFWQLDARAGLLVASGPFAVRLGWRTQLLDDRGMVDGEVHRDTFHGPTAGVGLAF